MIAIALIVFREVFEAALVVGLVLAASKGTPRRGWWVAAGVATGVVGATVVAGFAGELAAAAEGMGQDIFNAVILFIAVVMLGWHNVWMGRHGREMAAEAASLGRAVLAGTRPLYALALVVCVAVLREGSELALFLYGLAAGGNGGLINLTGGGILGLAGGLAAGTALYAGLVNVPLRHLFTVTSWMILLLAAGMASQGAGFLVQADLLPPLGAQLWDSSSLLSERSALGQTLHALIGYVSRPDGIQIVFYFGTVALIGLLMRSFGGGAREMGRILAAAIAIWTGLALVSTARADFQVHSPIVDYLEFEFEHNGAVTFDKKNSGLSNDQSYTNAIGYGVTPFWKVELEGETNAPPGKNLSYDATTMENFFQLTDQGEYWADLGFFAEYSHAASRGAPETVTFGPTAEKEIGNTLHTINLLVGKQFGHDNIGATDFQIAWQSRWRLNPLAEPGIEYYADIPDLESPGKLASQQHRIGPVLVGMYLFPAHGDVKYEVGYLFGLTRTTESGAVRWKLEYEAHF